MAKYINPCYFPWKCCWVNYCDGFCWIRWSKSCQVGCVNAPFVKMSNNWSFVETNCMAKCWLCINPSNSQWIFILWVGLTCGKARVLPLIVILMTAWLSSEFTNYALCFTACMLDWTVSTLSGLWNYSRLFDVWCLFSFGWDWFSGHNTFITRSHNSRAAIPSILNAASSDIISASVELCATAPCFLHIHERNTKVLGPIRHNTARLVDLLSSKYPANHAWQNTLIIAIFLGNVVG